MQDTNSLKSYLTPKTKKEANFEALCKVEETRTAHGNWLRNEDASKMDTED